MKTEWDKNPEQVNDSRFSWNELKVAKDAQALGFKIYQIQIILSKTWDVVTNIRFFSLTDIDQDIFKRARS